MTERPDVIFGAVVVVAAAAALALLGVLVEVGLQGAAGVAAIGAGLVSACILLAFELRDVPPGLVLASAIAIASLVALVRAARGVWREQLLLRALPSVALRDSAYRDTVPDDPRIDVHVLDARRQGAFCGGVLRPRVVLTTGLLDALDPAERVAVVAHELSHARQRGPLKLALGQLVVRAFFWVPVLRDLVERYLLLTELAADRAAIAATSPAALAGALAQVLESPKPAGSIGFADHAAARVDRLFDPSASLPRLLTPVRVALTGLALAAAGALAYSSPRPSRTQSDHLHGMTVNLLQHHLQARAIGFVATAAVVAAVLAGVRRYAGRARSTHAGRGTIGRSDPGARVA